MDAQELQDRTRQFALNVIRQMGSLPRTQTALVIEKQLIRCATSVGANFRSACKARSFADFRSKIGIVEEEADESIYWLELLRDTNLLSSDTLGKLIQEARELTAIFTATGRTLRQKADRR